MSKSHLRIAAAATKGGGAKRLGRRILTPCDQGSSKPPSPHLEALAGELSCEGRHSVAAECMLDSLVRGFAAYLAQRVDAGVGLGKDELVTIASTFNLVEQHSERAMFHRDQYRKTAAKILRRARQLEEGRLGHEARGVV